jgi:hypothetical protein
MVTLTAREACFAEYLEQEGHRYRHEPDVGGRKPDFVVELPTGARAAFEVFEPAVEKPANTVGSIDSYGAIRRGVDKRKYEQAKAARRVGMPFVLVVVPANGTNPGRRDRRRRDVRGPDRDLPLGPVGAVGGRRRVAALWGERTTTVDAAACDQRRGAPSVVQPDVMARSSGCARPHEARSSQAPGTLWRIRP